MFLSRIRKHINSEESGMKRYLFKLFSAIAVLALMVSLAPFEVVVAASPSVFINEIHYDNTGTDTGEAIEIAGPAGKLEKSSPTKHGPNSTPRRDVDPYRIICQGNPI